MLSFNEYYPNREEQNTIAHQIIQELMELTNLLVAKKMYEKLGG